MDGNGSGEGPTAVMDRGRMMKIGAAVGVALLVAIAITMGQRGGPPVLRLAGQTGGAPMEAAADADGRAGDMAIWNPVEYRFTLADSARFDAGEATAWRMQPPRDLSAAASELAAAFELGPVTPSPWDANSLVSGSLDGTGPSLWVGPGGDWYYSAPGDMGAWTCASEGIAKDSDAVVEPDELVDELVDEPVEVPACEPPPAPQGVPSADRAKALASTLFAGLGLELVPTWTEASADDWGAWVFGTVSLGGVKSDLSMSAAYGGNELLTSANGTLATPVRVGDYPTISADEAVVRLQAQTSGWANAAESGMLRSEAVDSDAVDAPVTDAAEPAPDAVPDAAPDAAPDAGTPDASPEPVETETPADPDEPVSSDDLVDPLPVLPSGELEVVEVTLVAVEPVLTFHVDADGALLLLPGYRFTSDDGGVWQVLAIADGYVEMVEPGGGGDATIDPVPEPAIIEPAPDVDGGGVSSSGASSGSGGGTDGEVPVEDD
jgi:hypothetical protein